MAGQKLEADSITEKWQRARSLYQNTWQVNKFSPVFNGKSGNVIHIAGKKVIPLFDSKIDYVNQKKGGLDMSKEERKELVERTAEKFTRLEAVQKAFVAGYMARAMEENGNHAKQTA